MKVAVELEDVELLVVFKLLGAVEGNLDDRAKDFGAAVADGKLKKVNHCVMKSPSGGWGKLGPEEGKNSADPGPLKPAHVPELL
jgi:hypothetical protein